MSFFKDWRYLIDFSYRDSLVSHLELARLTQMRQRRIALLVDLLRNIPDDVVCSFRDRLIEKGVHTKGGKYFDLLTHLARAVSDADKLSLIQKKRRLNVLDLGTGCGYFPLVCRHVGHSVSAIDKQQGKYGYAREKLSIDAVQWEITPQNPLPKFEQCFDLVTAFQPVFFLYRSGHYGEPWNSEEWEDFFSHLKGTICTNGKFYLGANNTSSVDSRSVLAMRRHFKKKGGKRISDGWMFEKNSL